jgi:hypothetical protein
VKTLISIVTDLSILAATLCAGLVFLFSGPVRADDDCSATVVPPTMHLKYDRAGRLAEIYDEAHRSRLRASYDAVLTSFDETEFKRELKTPNKWNQTEIWGPRRSIDYGSANGILQAIHTHEDFKYNSKGVPYGYQTSYYDLDKIDWEKLRGKDGVIRYTGPAVHENPDYVQTPIGNRTVAVPEPKNFKTAQCYPFEGLLIPLHAPAKPAEKKAQAVEEARTTKATDGKSYTIKLPEGSITVYDDDSADGGADQGSEQKPE